jgi:hypothetical protein
MKTNERSIAAIFAQDDHFEVVPATAAPARGAMETELDGLKTRLLKARVEQLTQLGAAVPMRRAANEAAAMAWLTPYPLLVFPALFEEKTHRLLLQLSKQARVLARTEGLVEAAA